MADCSVAGLLANAGPFIPLPERTLLVLQTQLLCEIRSVGVGGTAPQVITDEGAPVLAPATDPAFYIDKSPTAQTVLYWWNGSEWIPFG